jgi:hypothetical protein
LIYYQQNIDDKAVYNNQSQMSTLLTNLFPFYKHIPKQKIIDANLCSDRKTSYVEYTLHRQPYSTLSIITMSFVLHQSMYDLSAISPVVSVYSDYTHFH